MRTIPRCCVTACTKFSHVSNVPLTFNPRVAYSYGCVTVQPSLFGASLTSNIVRSSSAWMRSSLRNLCGVSMLLSPHDKCKPTSSRRGHPRSQTESRPLAFWRRGQSGCRSAGRTRPCPSISTCPSSQRTPNVRVFHLAGILAEGLLALLADEGHVKGLHQRVIALFLVALGAVEPFLAWPFSAHSSPGLVSPAGARTAGRADGDLRVQDVFAVGASAAAAAGGAGVFSGHGGARRAYIPHGGGAGGGTGGILGGRLHASGGRAVMLGLNVFGVVGGKAH